jgi:hypothetical protein
MRPEPELRQARQPEPARREHWARRSPQDWAWHRAQDLLDLTRDAARFRVGLSTVAPLAADPAQLLTVGGRVRLRSEGLGVDRSFRVGRLVWSLTDDDAIELELAALTPRLSESV